ncbi:MAG TPA: MraY family glycosyltransferase [Myxococcota bacterium]|nr:MraY family glycosyltransferase [Myxococcota bacterium]
MRIFAAILVVPWLVALVLTPATIRFAHRRDWLDRPTERKAHKAPVAMLGGVAVFASVFLGVGVLIPFVRELRELTFGEGSLGGLALGCVLMVALGLWDDLYDMAPLRKLTGQVAIAALTWALGFQVGPIELPFGLMLVDSPPVSFAVTVAWIVVVANAFNLIDGMDGLASGVALVTALTVFLLANQNGATVPVVAALALSGALAGFLRFNLPPARIFLGDAGALSIGYMTAVLALASYQKAPAAVALVVPLLVLGLPLLDTALAVIRRGLSHLSSHGARGLTVRELIAAVTRADRGHLHHLLLRNGLSVNESLVVLYALCIVLASLGLQTRAMSTELRFGLVAALLVSGYVALRALERRAGRREAEAALQADARAAELAESRRAAG